MRFFPRSEPVEPLDAIDNLKHSHAGPLREPRSAHRAQVGMEPSKSQTSKSKNQSKAAAEHRKAERRRSRPFMPVYDDEPLPTRLNAATAQKNEQTYTHEEQRHVPQQKQRRRQVEDEGAGAEHRQWPLDTEIPSGKMSPFPMLQSLALAATEPIRQMQPRSTNERRNHTDLPYSSVGRPEYTESQTRRTANAVSSDPQAVQLEQFYPDHEASFESVRGPLPSQQQSDKDYYNLQQQQQLHVSQQASALTTRDGALRKAGIGAALTMHQSSSDPTLTRSTPQQRRLKSAMKQSNDYTDKASNRWAIPSPVQEDSVPTAGSKLNFASLFPHGHGRKGVSAVDASKYSPQGGTIQAKLRRPNSQARFEVQKTVAPTPPVRGFGDDTSRTRAKVFENDIFDRAKTNIYRPPRGIQNWFDGVYISSEDEEEPAPPTKPPQPALKLSADEPLSSASNPYQASQKQRQSERQQLWAKRTSSLKANGMNESKDTSPEMVRQPIAAQRPVAKRQDNENSITHQKARPATQRRNSENSTVASSLTGHMSKRHPDGGSRLAHSRLGSQSVLSLSSESGDEAPRRNRDSVADSTIEIGSASAMGMARPVIPPRKLHTLSISTRDSRKRQTISTTHSSGSIPLRLGSEIEFPQSLARNTTGSGASSGPPAGASRKRHEVRDSTSVRSRSQRTTRSGGEKDEVQSTVGTFSDSPSEASRMMAVTDEEMMLLELMRQKRAAMQKTSFSEGYRLALKQEQEHLARRRESAHTTALKILRQKEEALLAAAALVDASRPLLPSSQNRESTTNTVFSEDAQTLHALQLRRQMSAIRKEDVDRALKLERFLAVDPRPGALQSSSEDDIPRPRMGASDLHAVAGAEVLSERNERPLRAQEEYVLPSTVYTKPRPQAALAPKTIERERSPSASGLDDEEFDQQHEAIRQFLMSNPDGPDLFPTPPSHAHARTENATQAQQFRLLLSPSPLTSPAAEPEHAFSTERKPATNRAPRPLLQHPQPMHPSRSQRHFEDQFSDSESFSRRSSSPVQPRALSTPKLHDPHPYLTPSLDTAPISLPSGSGGSGARTASPSTSHASPMTPTFPMPQLSSHRLQQLNQLPLLSATGHLPDITTSGSGTGTHAQIRDINIAHSDGHSPRAGALAVTEDELYLLPNPSEDVTDPKVTSTAPSKRRGGAAGSTSTRRPPPAIDTVASNNEYSKKVAKRIASYSSFTSAGEDVLAAWAELGGGSEMLKKRTRGR